MMRYCLLLACVFLLAACDAGSSPDSAATPGSVGDRVITPDPPGEAYRSASLNFIAIGDSGTGSEGQYAVGEAIAAVCEAKGGCDFVLGFGDNIYEEGVADEFDQQFEDKFERPFAPVDLPFYMVLGNHDNTGYVGGDGMNNARGNAQVAYHYRSGRSSERWQMPDRYYQQAFGEVRDGSPLIEIFALDSNPIAGGFGDADYDYSYHYYGLSQLNWINNAITNSSATFRIAMAHHPYLSNGQHGNAGNYDSVPSELLPVLAGQRWKDFLEEGVCDRADFFMSGHDHDLQVLEAVASCGRTEFVVSGAAGKTRELADTARNTARWQVDQSYGFFWLRAEEASGPDEAAQMCLESYVVTPGSDGLGVISEGELTPAFEHCYEQVAPVGIVREYNFSAAPFERGTLPELGQGSEDFNPEFSGPLAEYREALVSGLNLITAELPAGESRKVIAGLIAGMDTLFNGLDATAQAVQQDDAVAASQAIAAVLAAAEELNALDTSALPEPLNQLDGAFAAFADGVGAAEVGDETSGDASQDVAFIVGPLVQLARNLNNIADAIEEVTDEVIVLNGITHALSSLSLGTAYALEDLARLDSSGAGEALIGHVNEALTAIAEDMLLLNQGPDPIADNATLPGDFLSDALIGISREITEQLDTQAMPLLENVLDLFSPLTQILASLLNPL